MIGTYRKNPKLFGGKEGCKRGGVRSASKLTPSQREQRSAIAGNAVLRRYGIEYYSALGNKSWKDKQEKV